VVWNKQRSSFVSDAFQAMEDSVVDVDEEDDDEEEKSLSVKKMMKKSGAAPSFEAFDDLLFTAAVASPQASVSSSKKEKSRESSRSRKPMKPRRSPRAEEEEEEEENEQNPFGSSKKPVDTDRIRHWLQVPEQWKLQQERGQRQVPAHDGYQAAFGKDSIVCQHGTSKSCFQL
jgi:hypothetical protein